MTRKHHMSLPILHIILVPWIIQEHLFNAVLKGKNNDRIWAHLMKTSLHAKTKFCFIDGTVKKLASQNEDFYLWENVDSIVIARIINLTYSSLHGSISHAPTTKDA